MRPGHNGSNWHRGAPVRLGVPGATLTPAAPAHHPQKAPQNKTKRSDSPKLYALWVRKQQQHSPELPGLPVPGTGCTPGWLSLGKDWHCLSPPPPRRTGCTGGDTLVLRCCGCPQQGPSITPLSAPASAFRFQEGLFHRYRCRGWGRTVPPAMAPPGWCSQPRGEQLSPTVGIFPFLEHG